MNQESEKIVSAFDDPNFSRCISISRSICQSAKIREATAEFLLLTNGMFFVADGRAAKLCQESKKFRMSYGGYSTELMRNSFDLNEDSDITDQAINILHTAVTSFIKRYEDADLTTQEGKRAYLIVSTLLIQYLSRGLNTLTDELVVPDWIKDQYEKCLDLIVNGADIALNNFLKDLVELGNSSLVDFFSNLDPTEVFGLRVTTKPNLYYDNLIASYKADIKNPIQMYERWKSGRDEFRRYTIGLQAKDFFEVFKISRNQYNDTQKVLYDEFQLYFNEDVNVQYLIQMLNAN